MTNMPIPSAALTGVPAGVQSQGAWVGRRQLFVRFAGEAETATMYTSQALLILELRPRSSHLRRLFDVELEIIDKNIEVECELPENIKKTGDLMMQIAMRKRNRRKL